MKVFNLSFKATLLSVAAAVQMTGAIHAQNRNVPDTVAGIPVNYKEELAGSYILPDPLLTTNGVKITDAESWYQTRRPEVLQMFEENVYGKAPRKPENLKFTVFDKGTPVMDGKAIRKQIVISFGNEKTSPEINLLVYLPAKTVKPAPLLLNISFLPNFSMVNDPGIKRGSYWNREHQKVLAPENNKERQLIIEPFIDKGIGVATVYYGDIEPDFEGGYKYGVRSLYLKNGQKDESAGSWGAISAWAWGLSRVMDYIATDKQIDSKKVALQGMSRLGKTVLYTGAIDPRFALIIPCCSGEGGAALSRRDYGETIAHLVAPGRYAYQFCKNYQKYKDDPRLLPVDGHMLISLIAPRPMLLITGSTDGWSDPKGEFLAAQASAPVYRLFGRDAPGTDEIPEPQKALFHTLGFYMHEGGHAVLPSDYDIILQFILANLGS